MRQITLPQGHQSNLEVTWAKPGLAILGLTDSYIPSALFSFPDEIPPAAGLRIALFCSFLAKLGRGKKGSQRHFQLFRLSDRWLASGSGAEHCKSLVRTHLWEIRNCHGQCGREIRRHGLALRQPQNAFVESEIGIRRQC